MLGPQEFAALSREVLSLLDRATAVFERQVAEAAASAERLRSDARADAVHLLQAARDEHARLTAEVAALRDERDRLAEEMRTLRERSQQELAEIRALARQALAALEEPATRREALGWLGGDEGEGRSATEPETTEPETAEPEAAGTPLEALRPEAEPEAHAAVDAPRKQRGRVWSRLAAAARAMVVGVALVAGLALLGVVGLGVVGWQLEVVGAGPSVLPDGSLVLARPVTARSVRAGDAVVVARSGRPVQHVVSVGQSDGQWEMQTVADESEPEASTVATTQRVPRVHYWLPQVGTVLEPLLDARGQLVLAVLVGLVLVSWLVGLARRTH